MKNKFYITTPIYYANAKPHIGHAYTSVAADILARWNRQRGRKTFLLAGTDEHGLKIQKKAEEAGKNPQQFVDEMANEFKKLCQKLNIKYDNFIRTTDNNHIKAVQKVLQTLYDKGAIYKGAYEGLYCTGCEQFKNKNDLINGKCPEHNIKPKFIKEESYLLRMRKVQPRLIKKIESGELEIIPKKRRNEMLSFLKNNELEDISISRKNVSWGIPLPFDKNYTTYVWVDAFLNYLTGIGWDGSLPLEKGELERDLNFWPPNLQLIGKDILRVHATIWPAILMHLGIKLPERIFAHGHILSGGKKMSKTLGNVIGVDEMIGKFGADGIRYLLMSAGTFGEDIDVTMERMVEKYNADLANGLGNLVSRIVKLSENLDLGIDEIKKISKGKEFQKTINKRLTDFMRDADLSGALLYGKAIVNDLNKDIEKKEPWKLQKSDKSEFEKVMIKWIFNLHLMAQFLRPFMPETAEKIKTALETRQKIILFQRVK